MLKPRGYSCFTVTFVICRLHGVVSAAAQWGRCGAVNAADPGGIRPDACRRHQEPDLPPHHRGQTGLTSGMKMMASSENDIQPLKQKSCWCINGKNDIKKTYNPKFMVIWIISLKLICQYTLI